jgi:peptide/nickel transport system ATP-binding protein
MSAVLRIDDLRIETVGDDRRTLVDGVSLQVDRGESLGVVGESGSGKSLTVLAALGLLPVGTQITGGRITLDEHVLVDVEADVWAGERELRALRGRTAAMVFQDPMSSLDPLRAVGAQVASAIKVHAPKLGRRTLRERAIELLSSVGVRDAAERAATRPHQWSGGMRQRAMIAMAIAHDPLLLIADEPTTALDVTVQAQVMDLLAEVRERTGSALVLITHDLGLVAENSDRLAVMHHGRIVETGATRTVLEAPAEDYTRRLMAAMPAESERGAPEVRVGEEAALVAENIVVEYPISGRSTPVRAVDGVSLHIAAGETVAVVGESGCGKSSLAKAVLGIQPATTGEVTVAGVPVRPALRGRTAAQRELAQIVFQDPYSALDPRLTVHDLVAEPLRIRRAYNRGTVTKLLEDVGLDASYAKRLPGQLSGGQRQRVGIARALALRPRLLVLDEPVSALDVSIQAQVLTLLDSLQREHGLGYLFISHDLGVVRSIADRVIVMQEGRVVEEAPTAQIFRDPQHPFTRQLLAAVPRLDGPRRTARQSVLP